MSPNVTAAVRMLQFGQTTRYHTEVMLKSQDVAQHSFSVAWLCWLLSGRQPTGALIMTALAHDAGERWTGDLPAPTKRATGLGERFDALESDALSRSGYEPYELDAQEVATLKLADALEGAFHCARELMLGSYLPVDPDRGGAGLNFMNYVAERLSQSESFPSVHKVGTELYLYLKEIYDIHTYACRPPQR